MVVTVESFSIIKGNTKLCSVVVPTECVLCMIIYSTSGCLNMSSADYIPIVSNRVIIMTVETLSCNLQNFPITNRGKSCKTRYYL